DEVVAGAGEERLLEAQLPEAAAELCQPGGCLAGAVMDLDAPAVLGIAEGQRRVDDVGRRDVAEDVAAGDVAHLDADEVDGDALAGLGAVDRLVAHLHATDPRAVAGGLDRELVAAADRAGPQPA